MRSGEQSIPGLLGTQKQPGSHGGKQLELISARMISFTRLLNAANLDVSQSRTATNVGLNVYVTDNTRNLASNWRQPGKHSEERLHYEGLHEDNNANIQMTSCMDCRTLWSGCLSTQRS